jgi:type 1 fimbriae regulatory protein FimB
MTNLGKTYKRKTRKFLYENEVEKVVDLCKETPFPLRNKTLILVTYMHAFRAGEVCNLKWKHIDFNNNVMSTHAQKGGKDCLQPLWECEKELLLELNEERLNRVASNSNIIPDDEYVFTSSRWGVKFEPQNFYKLTLKLGQLAGFDFIFTPHMLRHARGAFLANNDVHILKIKALLRHARVSSTEIYTHLAANKFKGINEGSLFG